MKAFAILFFVLVCFIFLRCSEDSPEIPPAQDPTGILVIKSNPSGAQIYLMGTNTGKTTPDSISNLDPGTYDGFLYLQYYDTAYFTATVFANVTTIIDTSLEDTLPIVEFIFDYQTDVSGDSVRFYFTINQDVTMDSIIVLRPTNLTGTYVTNKYSYSEELFEHKDQVGNLIKYYLPPPQSGLQYYPEIQNRNYYFNLFGHKAYGTKAEFRSYYQVGL